MWRFTMQTALPGIRGGCLRRPLSNSLAIFPIPRGEPSSRNFLSRPSAVERAVVMLQKEFIDRILATPDDDAFGLLSLRIQKNWIPRALKTIPPEAFHPRPRIDSTVMLLTPRPARELPPYDDRLMDELMRKAFFPAAQTIEKTAPRFSSVGGRGCFPGTFPFRQG